MATPSKTPTASTPRVTTLSPASVRKMASPRPVTAGKSLAYKSPMAAMKTPASAHSHNISTSSQPSNTPLLAHTFTEGAVNLDSPSAALMGFSHSHGLTPLPSGLGGLGLQSTPTRQAGEAIPRDTQGDKVQRLQDVVSLLKTRVAGRGITRDGVVRVARLSGFTTYWDEDLLTVAGNCVDLEIMFDSEQKDAVKDAVLKISASGSDQRQEEASDILKRDLAQKPDGNSQNPWNVLDGFAKNVGRLRQLDSLSDSVNCFEAVDGLYEAMKQVWEEEKKRLTWRSDLHHVCGGSMGRARMNKRRTLGVAMEYWIPQHELAAATVPGDSGEAELSGTATDTEQESDDLCWTAHISCEAGFPSLMLSREWLHPNVLSSDDSMEEPHNAKPLTPAWRFQDLQDGTTSTLKDTKDSTKADDSSASVPAPINAHFTFTLDPVLYLPLSVVDSLVGQGLMFTADRSKVARYKQVLDAKDPPRWLKSIETYSEGVAGKSRKHSYAFSASNHECYPVSTVGFAHPNQLSSLVPTLRQYACLWSILRKLVASPVVTGETFPMEDLFYKPGQRIRASVVQRRSNIRNPVPRKEMLADTVDVAKIDVALSFADTTSLMKPKLEVYIPLNGKRNGSSRQEWFCYAAFVIEENGKMELLSAQIPGVDNEKGKKSAGRVLALSEDIGVLAQWMLDQASR